MIDYPSTRKFGWAVEIHAQLIAQDYPVISQYYEKLIAHQPWEISHYWYLGLSYFLQGHEADAELTWFMPMLDADEDLVDTLRDQLSAVLDLEVERQLVLGRNDLVHILIAHLLELQPNNPNHWLQWLNSSIKTDSLTNEVIEKLLNQISTFEDVKSNVSDGILLEAFTQVINLPILDANILKLAKQLLDLAENINVFIETIFTVSSNRFYGLRQVETARIIVDLGLSKAPDHLDLLGISIDFCNNTGLFQEALHLAKRYLENSSTLEFKLLGNFLLLKCLLRIGNRWSETEAACAQHKTITFDYINSNPVCLNNNLSAVLITCISHLSYLEDNPVEYRSLQNQLSYHCHKNIESSNKFICEKYRTSRKALSSNSRKLKIGYLSQSFRYHSIGWLSRWLFQYHNRDQFEIYIYQAHHAVDEFTNTYFRPYADTIYDFQQASAQTIAEQIFEDTIDILVDLDSVTFTTAMNVLALKPAPLQVSWLGWDASGLPTIDYFICDRYVLPEEADSYYQEKLWRMPETYIAVDGFEIGTPSLRRDSLQIPGDAIVYWSAQTASKRHPDLVRLQMAILKGVPTSHFLIKGLSDQSSVQELFYQLAQDSGISLERLHFLPLDETELTHRANLQIADIVLDTFPYNGATTTLEALWLGIPLVTRVGQQFSARNSFSFMTHAGIQEGIAWSDDEYVEWGIRLGLDSNLRYRVRRKLWESHRFSALWNAKRFTRNLENAYQAMWSQL